jgi:hypothetical protein
VKSLQGSLPLLLPINNRLSLLPRGDAGNESRSLRSIRSHPFDPYLRDVRASPSGCCRFGQARMTQASTILEIRIERIERMKKRIVAGLGDGAARMGSGIFLVGNRCSPVAVAFVVALVVWRARLERSTALDETTPTDRTDTNGRGLGRTKILSPATRAPEIVVIKGRA